MLTDFYIFDRHSIVIVDIYRYCLLFIFIVHTQSKDVYVIFVVLCIWLYIVTVFHLELFLCLHVRLICALNYYLLTYLLTYRPIVMNYQQRDV